MPDDFENHIRTLAQNYPYPKAMSKPQSARRGTSHRMLRYAASLLLIVLFTGFAVPDIRAAIAEFLQIGVVRIELAGESTSGDPLNLADLSGRTTLIEAQNQVDFDLLSIPNHPPNDVFVQDNDLVIFVWTDRAAIQTALYQIADDSWRVLKTSETVTDTTVRQHPAYWVKLQQPVQFVQDGITRYEFAHFVDGHVLVWWDENSNITYRLETTATLDEARQWAESLEPLN